MQGLGFPDYPQHREQHRAFTLHIASLKDRLMNEGPTQGLVATVCLTINGWLIEHISGMDRAIGRFIKEKKTEI
jgi:hemerythrin